MRKVTKLTPATLKRIIAEERYKLKNTSRSKRNRKLTNTQLVERYLKILKLLKESQGQKSREAAKINEARKIIKRKLLKRL
tara:strand:+ start:287 stop:529 length:243 start_codon:yes stop_codon:yes gene_type:complete